MTLLETAGVTTLGLLARHGTLGIELPSGAHRTIGSGEPKAHLLVRDGSVIGDILKQGLTGFAEAYMDDRLATPDLPELLDWGIANSNAWFTHPVARLTTPVRRFWQRIRPERRHQRVASMNDHYNLGNGFYQAWLDETMTYSSARFQHPEQTLEKAQINKYRTIAERAGLRPGMTVLEIGCGWGGFAEYAAGTIGCDVVGITLSEQQAIYARKRLANAGLGDRTEILVQDFREVQGGFDAVVSIEMIESVDESHWEPLFETIRRVLDPSGYAAMQIITIDDREWERYRSRADFIQQYIFPGGQIPAPKILHGLADRAGLRVAQVETFGLDYARTLRSWRESFTAGWPSISRENHLDERFRRMWDLYLSLCEAGFRLGRIDVSQWALTRSG